MNPLQIEAALENLDARVTTVEQILPTLLTREEFKTAMAKVATKEDLLALREDFRNHFNAVAERLESQISLIAEGHGYLASSMDALERKVDRRFNRIDVRLDRTDARLGKVEGRLEKVETRLGKVEGRLEKVETRLDKVEGRLEKVETRLGKVEGRLEKVETRLGKAEGRLEKADTRLGRVAADVKYLRRRL